MNAAVTKKQVASVLADRFGDVFEQRANRLAEFLPTGIREVDSSLPGFPRGAITEIHGAASSGRASLLLAALALATRQDETCALVDCTETFDVASASKAGVNFERLLWVCCNDKLEAAFKAVDLLLHGGGFGLVVLNLSDVPAKLARRIISSWWFRFRRAVENTPTALLVITSITCVRSCAALVLKLKSEGTVWPGTMSLISENCNGGLTEKREAPRLSLVAPAIARSFNPSSLPHSYFFHGLQVRVDQERPRAWSDAVIKFTPRLH